MYQFQWCKPEVSKNVGVPKRTDKIATVRFLFLFSIYSSLYDGTLRYRRLR